MNIRVKRAYEPPEKSDGYRVLVDRVWPRGEKKEELEIDRWLKSAAPASELRKWLSHDPLTLVYSARDAHHNNAVALREYLNRR